MKDSQPKSMNLPLVNQLLEQTLSQLEVKLPQLEKLESEYWLKLGKYSLNSKLGNQISRDAEAKILLEQEGMLDKYYLLKGEVRTLLTKKEILIEISRNLRSLNMQGNKQEVTNDLPF